MAPVIDGLWPGGHRVAVCLTWDVDVESWLLYRSGGQPIRLLSELEQTAFGLRRAIPLITRMLGEEDLPATFFVPAYIARRAPQAVQALDAAGFEIGCHGYLHEALPKLEDPVQEAEILKRSLGALEDVLGHAVRGYRSPSWELNRWSLDLLKQHGIAYDSSLMGDIYPYGIATPAGTLLEIPVHWNLNDFEHWGHTAAIRQQPIAAPSAVFDLWRQEFDGIRQEGGVFVLTMHPQVSGRPGLLATVRRLIAHIRACPDVWWTTPGAIAAQLGARFAHGAPIVHTTPADRPLPFD